MKTKMLLIALSLTCSLASATNRSEGSCMSAARLGEAIAQSREMGIPLKDTLDIKRSVSASKIEERNMRNFALIAEYVYMMEYTGPEAKKIIYHRCMAGQYD